MLITTDGSAYDAGVIWRLFAPLAILAQVIKTWGKGRVRSVETRVVMGDDEQMREALRRSEDSVNVNTSFVERLNLTIRQGSACLRRRSLAQARPPDLLADHLELRRCHDNFVRPHRGLKFSREIRTPAMQAGLADRRLTLREIFSARLTNPTFVRTLLVWPLGPSARWGQPRTA